MRRRNTTQPDPLPWRGKLEAGTGYDRASNPPRCARSSPKLQAASRYSETRIMRDESDPPVAPRRFAPRPSAA